MQVEGPEQGAITTIRERGDNEARGVPEIFVAVRQLGVDHTSDDILFLPVIAHLAEPLEIILSINTCNINPTFHHYPERKINSII